MNLSAQQKPTNITIKVRKDGNNLTTDRNTSKTAKGAITAEAKALPDSGQVAIVRFI